MSAVDEAAAAFDDGTFLYVHPDAVSEFGGNGLTVNEIAVLDRRAGAQSPVFVALLPQSTAAEGTDLAEAVFDTTKIAGTYLVLLPDSSGSAGSTVIGDVATRLATTALVENSDNFDVVDSFIRSVNVYTSGGAAVESGDTFTGGAVTSKVEGGEGSSLGWVVGLGAVAAGAVWYARRRAAVSASI